MLMDPTLALLGVGAFLAGMVDAVVGGGGLIQIPLLFSAFPQAAPATLFGTNKLASVFGTAGAAVQYSRRVSIPWRAAGPAALAAAIGSCSGARAVVLFPPAALRPLILVLLILVALYTFLRKDFGIHHRRLASAGRECGLAILIGAALGFYDGFFGPGTGSFLIFLFIRILGMDFLHASVSAKIVNVSTNLAAIAVFVSHGAVFWQVALVMACCNLLGSRVGTGLALRHGVVFIRKAFLAVVLVLILRFAADTFL
ncbi:TSUP family transporter [Zoogloea sp.]|uniref:sulfite exporter TauE/SafE family protein n=1 Tax=Zoogloea sp. TaxID=49181 RepID=UPI001AC27357|nr:TSUP family transporter [Zoogloea sp.]MBN8285032.1 TSUP family transporter [Zoogloea sp.]